jgi:hypothetical protein
MYTAVLIASTNKSLIAANTRLTRKQAKKRSYIVSGGVLTEVEVFLLRRKEQGWQRKRMLQSQGRSQTKLQKGGIIGNQLYSQLGGSLIGSGRVYCSGGYIYLVAWKKCRVRL